MVNNSTTAISIIIEFGPLAPELRRQLKGKGVPRDRTRSFQRVADAITLLKYGGYLSQQGANHARKVLYKRILKEVSHA
jgi:hypothetical protein